RMISKVVDVARSRLEGGIPIHARQMDMGEACAHVIEEVESAHPRSSIAFERSGDLAGTWDPDRIAQVIATVVTSAVEHSTERVVVRACEEGERVHVEVDGDPK